MGLNLAIWERMLLVLGTIPLLCNHPWLNGGLEDSNFILQENIYIIRRDAFLRRDKHAKMPTVQTDICFERGCL